MKYIKTADEQKQPFGQRHPYISALSTPGIIRGSKTKEDILPVMRHQLAGSLLGAVPGLAAAGAGVHFGKPGLALGGLGGAILGSLGGSIIGGGRRIAKSYEEPQKQASYDLGVQLALKTAGLV